MKLREAKTLQGYVKDGMDAFVKHTAMSEGSGKGNCGSINGDTRDATIYMYK